MSTADRKRARLRAAMSSGKTVVTIGVHDAMSEALVDRYGFDAVWVSGLGVSTMAHALPDLNLITMTESLDAAARIDHATSLPVIADCDDGFGSLSNVVRTLREYEQAGISGISIEDNLFPKRNSLYSGESKCELIPSANRPGGCGPRRAHRRLRTSRSSPESSRLSPATGSTTPAHALRPMWKLEA